MSPREAIDAILQREPVRPGSGVRFVLLALVAAGLAALLVPLALGRARWTLESLYVATLVLAGVGQAGVVLSAMFQLTRSRWAQSFRRLLELTFAAAPFALAGLVVLVATASRWAPFAGPGHLEGGKGLWLALPFWGLRNLLVVAGLFALSGWWLYLSLRPDLGAAVERGRGFPGRLTGWLTRGWRGLDAEVAASGRRLSTLAPIVCLGYALGYSMVGFDLVMALDPRWYSTLFGAYFFAGNLYLMLALTVLLGAALHRRSAPPAFFSGKHFGLLGTLTFAFVLLNGDFFWSQFLTIWYGNLPEETAYVIHRTMDRDYPWRYLAWAILGGFFAIPFVGYLFKAIKWVPRRSVVVAAVIVLALVSERFLLTAPALLGLPRGAGIAAAAGPYGLALLATAGALAAAGLLFVWLLPQVPLLPIADPLLLESLRDTQEEPE